jgi:hypothetical protein
MAQMTREVADFEARCESDGEEEEADEEQAGVDAAEVGDGRKVVEEFVGGVALELVFLDEIHDASDGSESEGSVGDDREGGVEFHPRVGEGDAGDGVGGSEGGEEEDRQDERGGEGTHQGESIGGADDEVDEDDGPAEEDEDFEEVGDRAGADLLAAEEEENAGEAEAGDHGCEVEAGGPEFTRAEGVERVAETGEIAEGGGDEPDEVH